MFYLVGLFRTSAQETASQVALRELLCEVGVGEESSYIELCNQKQVVWISEICLWIKENQISQVKEFSAFVCMVRCKSLDSLKSFFSYDLSFLGTVSCVFHILSSSMLTVGSGWSLVAARSHRYSFWVPFGLRNLHLEIWNSWLLSNSCLLIWLEVFHFLYPTLWNSSKQLSGHSPLGQAFLTI